jgi:hypothetical protein
MHGATNSEREWASVATRGGIASSRMWAGEEEALRSF